MAPATVSYMKEGTKPPVFLAGDFSAWQCMEMEHEVGEGQEEYRFYKTIEAEESKELQYKFRIGHGDWWVLDETAPVVTDNIGNRNNLLIMSAKSETTSDHAGEASQQEQSHNVQPAEEKQLTEEHSQLNENEAKEETGAEVSELPDKTGEVETAPELSKEGQENLSTSQIDVQPRAADEQVPTLVVDKVDESPSFGEDFGAAATFAEKEAFAMRSADAEPDAIVVHPEKSEIGEESTASQLVSEEGGQNEESGESGVRQMPSTPVPEVASTAAEVGESAAVLDQEVATPEISDSEAGKIGLRRLSTTPIPVVADTAAEVADSAAELDREESGTPDLTEEEAGHIGMRRMSLTPISQVAETAAEVAAVAALLDKKPSMELLPGHIPFDDDDDDKEYPVTPEDERAPLFSHEKYIPSIHTSPPKSPDHNNRNESQSPAIVSWEERSPLFSHSNGSPRREDPIPTPDFEDLNPLHFNVTELPSTREGIMAHLERLQREIPEDEVRVTSPTTPMSPLQQFGRPDVLTPGDSPRSERSNSLNSPLHDPRAVSLTSIAEENDTAAAEEAEPQEGQATQLVQDEENLEPEQYAEISKIVEDDVEPETIMESLISEDHPAAVESAQDNNDSPSQSELEVAQAVDAAADEAADEIVIDELAAKDSQEETVPLAIPPGSSEQETDEAPAEIIGSVVKEDVQNDKIVDPNDRSERPDIVVTGDDAVSDDTPTSTPPTSSEGGGQTFSGYPGPADVGETITLGEFVGGHNTESRSPAAAEAPTIIVHPATEPVTTLPHSAAFEEEIVAEARTPEPSSTSVPEEIKTHIHTQQEDTVVTESPAPAPSSKVVPDEVKTHTHTQQEDTVVTSRTVTQDTTSSKSSEPATTIVESTITKRKPGRPSSERPETPVTLDGAASARGNHEENAGLMSAICTAVMGWVGGFFANICGSDRERNKKAKNKAGGKAKRVIGATAAVILLVVVVNAVWTRLG